MKHNVPVTVALVAVFLFSQLMGLVIIQQYVSEKSVDAVTGEITTEYENLPMNIDRPEIEQGYAYIYITGAIIVGTLIAFVLIRFRSIRVWKAWFFLSVLLCLTVALKPLLAKVFEWVIPALTDKVLWGYNSVEIATFAAAVVLTYMKIFKHNVYVNNFTEVFIYGGLSAIFVPIIDLRSAFILLGVISVYDMYAVWKSKHMVKLATFQTESKVFAGLSIPYGDSTPHEVKHHTSHAHTKKAKVPKPHKAHKEVEATREIEVVETHRTAILGGGDIGFPMFFAGVVMNATTKPFWVISIIPICTALALYLLLTLGEQNKFYPAMPFLSAGCIAGYLVTLLF